MEEIKADFFIILFLSSFQNEALCFEFFNWTFPWLLMKEV